VETEKNDWVETLSILDAECPMWRDPNPALLEFEKQGITWGRGEKLQTLQGRRIMPSTGSCFLSSSLQCVPGMVRLRRKGP
jgi:hypothetical protein